MESQQNEKALDNKALKPISTDRENLLRDLHTLPRQQILDRILEHENPQRLIRELPSEDFFWLLKKFDKDDCLPLLKLASEEQWQYLLDLEIWTKDRFHLGNTWLWLKRLQQTDLGRLVRWLFSEGESFACYHLFQNVEVIVTENQDEIPDLPSGFFSLDGVFHIRVTDSEHQETIENIIRGMAKEDFSRYQALFLRLSRVLPAEMEEEMNRMRNIRLAEHGFLPLEEALSVYAPLDPDTLRPERPKALSDILIDEEIRPVVPVSPLHHTGTENVLTKTISKIQDPLFVDEIRLEFAGLCNQILSADGLLVQDLDILVKTCRRAARYLNLAIERLCGKDLSSAERILREHSLVSLFRVGFGLAMKLKWEADRWLEGSWFYGQGLDSGFWGEHWGQTLSGLLEKRPQLYVGLQQEEEYRDFEWLSELGECLKILRRLMVLDGLLERLAGSYQLDEDMVQASELTFRPFLFNLWARRLLDMEPCFSAISLTQLKGLFQRLRAGERKSPYQMARFQEIFIKDFMAYASQADPEAASILRDTLSLIWEEFREEYAWLSMGDLDSRYSKFILVTP